MIFDSVAFYSDLTYPQSLPHAGFEYYEAMLFVGPSTAQGQFTHQGTTARKPMEDNDMNSDNDDLPSN